MTLLAGACHGLTFSSCYSREAGNSIGCFGLISDARPEMTKPRELAVCTCNKVITRYKSAEYSGSSIRHSVSLAAFLACGVAGWAAPNLLSHGIHDFPGTAISLRQRLRPTATPAGSTAHLTPCFPASRKKAAVMYAQCPCPVLPGVVRSTEWLDAALFCTIRLRRRLVTQRTPWLHVHCSSADPVI